MSTVKALKRDMVAPRHFLDLSDFDGATLKGIVDSARRRKKARQGFSRGALDKDAPLKDKMLALIFEKPSTRTRISFDVGMQELGGRTLVLTGAEMQLGRGASSGGFAARSAKPKRTAACTQDAITLFASPTQATVRPRMGPFFSSNVITSAMIWHGCDSFVRPLITGTVAFWASSVSILCSSVRIMMAST